MAADKIIRNSKLDTFLSKLATKLTAIFWRKAETTPVSIDSTPTANSNNLVKSGGVKSYVDNAIPSVPTALSQLSDDSTHRLVTDTEKSTWNGKQNALTFDSTPTANSTNPVTSGGIKTYVDGAIPTVPTISTDIATDSASDTKTASPKAVATVTGSLANLNTTAKTNLVAAINEVAQTGGSPYKGIFTTSSALNTAYPSPEDGDYAYVKAGTALHIYTALGGSWSDTSIEASTGLENVFTNVAKMTLLSVLEKVAWIDADGQAYIDNLRNALLGSLEVESITATFTPGTAVILDTMTLDDLKQYLTVTAEFSDGTSGEITSYALSGSMVTGSNTITVTYGEFTDTFSVTVLHNYSGAINNWIYHPNNGTAAYSDGKIRLKCGNSSDVTNWSVWVADGKKTLWSAVEHKSVKIRIKVNANDYDNIGAFGIGIYQNSSITSMGAAYAIRTSFGAEGTWVLAADGYYETVSPFVCETSNFTGGSLTPGSSSTFGLWCYARSMSQYQEIYDVQVFEVTP